MLPLDIAHTKSMLQTRVSHKEGITYKKKLLSNCADFIKKYYNKTELSPLLMDFNLVKGCMEPEMYALGCNKRDEIMKRLEILYR